MRVTERGLNRATLARQLLLRRERISVVDAVRRVVALQAQDPVGPYLGLHARVDDFDPDELDAAFAAHEVVRAQLMRITIHAVAAADYPAFHAAVLRTLRGARLYDERFRRAGLSIEETDALLPEVVAWLEEPRTTEEVEAWLDARIGVRERPGVGDPPLRADRACPGRWPAGTATCCRRSWSMAGSRGCGDLSRTVAWR